MSKAEDTLKKAVQLALDNGWQPDVYFKPNRVSSVTYYDKSNTVAISFKREKDDTGYTSHAPLSRLFYDDKSFVKALWGEETVNREQYHEQEAPRDVVPWRYHLMHMVVSDDPVAYLETTL